MKIRATISDLFGATSNMGPSLLSTQVNEDIGGAENFTGYFCFEPGQNKDELLVCASNGVQERRTGVSIADSEKFDAGFLISITRMTNICSRLDPDMEVTFVVEGNRCYIKSDVAEYDLVSSKEHEFPKQEDEDGGKRLKVTQANLKFIFNQTAFAMAQNDPRYYLEGILVVADVGQLTGVATNGHRLAMCSLKDMKEMKEKAQAILPRAFVEQADKILDYSDEIVEVSIGEKKFSIAGNRFYIGTNIIEGKYPDWEKVIPDGMNWSLEINKEEFLLGIQRALAICDKPDEPISIKRSDGKIVFSAKNPATGEQARAMVKAKSEGEGFDLGINASYLMDAVSAAEDEDVVMEMVDPTTAVKLHGKKAKESLFLIMPVKL